jgi:hypothetical protein
MQKSLARGLTGLIYFLDGRVVLSGRVLKMMSGFRFKGDGAQAVGHWYRRPAMCAVITPPTGGGIALRGTASQRRSCLLTIRTPG